MNRDLMTPGEVAALAGCSVDLVRYWDRTGKLPALRTATGRRIFRRRNVEKFLADREAERARELVKA